MTKKMGTQGSSLARKMAQSADPTERFDLREAFQVKLLEIAARHLTARSLFELETMARIGRELLAVGQDPRAMNMHGNMVQSHWNGMQSPYAGGADFGVVGVDAVSGPLAPSPSAENFGATMLRELLALKASAKPAVESTLALIADARAKGLDDVAERLEQKLFDSVSTVTQPATSSNIVPTTKAVKKARVA